MAQRRAVYRSAERTEVVMIAHALELRRLSVEEKSFFGYEFEFADAEAGIVGVSYLAVDATFVRAV